ncbi:MAG: DUF1499 domain-containing protein [Methyloceanibacter sp.]
MTVNYAMARYSTARFEVPEACEAKWARRLALFFLQLLILTVLLHRFLSLGTPAAINLILVSMAGLFVALAIAIASLVRIWFGGQKGAAQDFGAIFVALLGLAVPLYFMSQAVLLPRLNDVQTSPGDPLNFTALGEARPPDANPIKPPDTASAALQAKVYPDIGPMVLERSAPEVYALVREAVEQLGWNIVVNETPGESGVGRIEATDSTLIMGFTDDVLVRIKGDDAHAVIDVRSVSRYGVHDLGANANRIRTLYAQVDEALEKGEKTVLEQAAPKEEKPAAAKPVTTQEPVKKRRVRKRR